METRRKTEGEIQDIRPPNALMRSRNIGLHQVQYRLRLEVSLLGLLRTSLVR